MAPSALYSQLREHQEAIKHSASRTQHRADADARAISDSAERGLGGEPNARTHRTKWTLLWWKAQKKTSSTVAPSAVAVPVSTVSLVILWSMSFVSVQCAEELARTSWRGSHGMRVWWITMRAQTETRTRSTHESDHDDGDHHVADGAPSKPHLHAIERRYWMNRFYNLP